MLRIFRSEQPNENRRFPFFYALLIEWKNHLGSSLAQNHVARLFRLSAIAGRRDRRNGTHHNREQRRPASLAAP